ncbi:phage tail tape measure protein [Cohnella lupini]|uniref:TP901 family phage tail tape measure protein n=1 Tax=Cohnella lupini TaxID=1294267 RepID=A0A3D9I5X3_9BACL|nr:phage tail tape measure protein [Cohnella lupini]RED57168.1 TP901 family phage tail tape measure protein [Cohnella lupini]
MSFDLTARLRLIDGMSGQLRNASNSLTRFSTGVLKTSIVVGGLSAAIAATAVAASSVKKAMNFEAQMASVSSLDKSLKKGTEGYKQMSALALEMGAKTQFGALDAASGIEELLKAGLTPAAVQAGGLEAALNLATAGGLELANAAEIMSTALNSFKRDGLTAAEASNILAGTANASATGVDELRQSLAAVASVASGVGLTFEDTNIALGLFANNGIKSSDAGTSLKTMLQNLQPTTKDQIALFEALGLVTEDGANAFYDSRGNIKSLQSISGSLRKSLGRLTNQQRALALETMFGTDAVRAGNILYNEGADGVKKFQTAMKKVSALDVAKEKMNTAAGAVEQFKGALETLQISALLPTMPLIQDAFGRLAGYVDANTPAITAAMQRMTDKVKNYLLTHFTNNPEFQRITSLQGKITFVYEDIMKSFNEWMNAGGRDKVNALSENLVNTMATALSASAPLLEAATKLGAAVAEGVATGFWELIKKDPKLAAIIGGATGGAFAGLPGVVIGAGAGTAQHYTNKAVDTLVKPTGNWMTENVMDPFAKFIKPATDFIWGDQTGVPISSFNPFPHAAGLDNVPYDQYPASLHRGEMVLTRTEASAVREGGGKVGNGGAPTVNITGNTFHIRNESDIDALAAKLAYAITQGRG